jgi:hypothetical protein
MTSMAQLHYGLQLLDAEIAAEQANDAAIRERPYCAMSGRVGLGVEVEDHRLAAELRELDGVAVLVGEGEVRGLLSLLDHGRDPNHLSRRGLTGSPRLSSGGPCAWGARTTPRRA